MIIVSMVHFAAKFGDCSHQRPHLKELVITRRPIVQQHKTKNMLLGLLNRHSFSPRHRLRDIVSHLKLKVQPPGRPIRRLGINAIGEVDIGRPRDGTRSWQYR